LRSSAFTHQDTDWRTEAVTGVSETGVPGPAFQAARAAFEEKELVDLTIAIIGRRREHLGFKLGLVQSSKG
jgi:hypothetical protein